MVDSILHIIWAITMAAGWTCVYVGHKTKKHKFITAALWLFGTATAAATIKLISSIS